MTKANNTLQSVHKKCYIRHLLWDRLTKIDLRLGSKADPADLDSPSLLKEVDVRYTYEYRADLTMAPFLFSQSMIQPRVGRLISSSIDYLAI